MAKETLSLAEGKLLKADKREFDAAWQEYVNHATMKVIKFEKFYLKYLFDRLRLCKPSKIKLGVKEHMKKNLNFIKNVNKLE